tara:strand:- start:1514 stop:2332 length:819 start_codon:yes stop_codon:yes gene_type:complete
VLNKLKKLLMKKNPDPVMDNKELEGTNLELTDNNLESDAEQRMNVIGQNGNDGLHYEEVDLEMEEIEPTKEEVSEMNDQASIDPEYLEYSSEAVGYENREQQWDTYRIISNYISEEDSVLDFGCARGDFERFYEQEYNETLDYIGIDMNQQLIDAGKKVYENEVELRSEDWFKLDDDLKQDWSINIGSNNLRYDGDTVRDDMKYLQDTITAMMKHCEKGSVILLASDITKIEDGLTNYNAGTVFNWAQEQFGNVALDHTFSNDIFTLIIYKN